MLGPGLFARKRLPRLSARAVVVCLCGVAMVAVGLYALPRASRAARQETRRAVTVSLARAVQSDIPEEFEGLAVAEASQTVTLRPQVDGQIVSIAVQDGAHVARGQVLATLDSRALKADLDVAVANQARDEALLTTARLDLARAERLRESDFVAQQVLETRKAQVAQAEAVVRSDRAAVDRARVMLGYTEIVSPLDGIAGLVKLHVGALVRASETSAVILVNKIQPISVVITMPGGRLDRIRAAMRDGEVPVDVYERQPRRKLAVGRLQAIDNQIDPATATVKLKAVFDNTDEALWPGQLLEARVRVGTTAAAVVVPSTAVLQGPEGAFVYRVRDGRAEPMPVSIGADLDGRTVVRGIAAGEVVVAEGQFKLQPGAPVEDAKAR